MELQESTNRLVELIRHSQSPYHTMKEAISQLEKAGFERIHLQSLQRLSLERHIMYQFMIVHLLHFVCRSLALRDFVLSHPTSTIRAL